MTETAENVLRGQIAVVTGAGRGIGRAVSLLLAEMGATVVLVARGKPPLDSLRTEIESAGGQAESAACDLRNPEAIGALGQRIRASYGRCDILANNAGVG